jgi:hypothetical protein
MPHDNGVILNAIEHLRSDQNNGFKAVHERLDRMNGRVTKNAGAIILLEATAVTTKGCEKIRAACQRIRGAGWRTFAIASASGIVVALVTAIIMATTNRSG